MTISEKENLSYEIKQMINIEFVKQDINSIQFSEKDVDNFTEYFNDYEYLDKERLDNDTETLINKICEEIPNNLNNLSYKNIPNFEYGVRVNEFLLLKPIKLIDKVYVRIYVANECDKYSYEGVKDTFLCYYRPRKNILHIDVAVSNDGSVYKEPLYDLISNELKRVYKLRIKGHKRTNNLYTLSKDILGNKWYKNQNINYYLYILLYFTSFFEVEKLCREIEAEKKRKSISNFENLKKESVEYEKVLRINNIFNRIIKGEISSDDYDENLFLNYGLNDFIEYLAISIRYMNKMVKKETEEFNIFRHVYIDFDFCHIWKEIKKKLELKKTPNE